MQILQGLFYRNPTIPKGNAKHQISTILSNKKFSLFLKYFATNDLIDTKQW